MDPQIWELSNLASSTLPHVAVPNGLYHFQTEGAQFIERAGGNAFVGDDPGTGKTVITLGWIYPRRNELQNILIVAPTVVVYKWRDEIKQWLGENADVIDGIKVSLGGEAKYKVMSYTMMRLRVDELTEQEWDLVVFDEAHHLKNRTAQQTKAGIKVGRVAKQRLMLSGKPFLNQPAEMFYPLHIMDPMGFPDWYRFVTRYTMGKQSHWAGLINGEELQERLAHCLIRRTKQDVMPELPELQRVMLPFKLEKADATGYSNAKKLALRENNPLTAANQLRMAIGQAKKRVAVDWSKNFMDENPNEKLVIYTHYLDVMSYLLENLQEYGVSAIDGSVPAKERMARAEHFQNFKNPHILIINTAANEGINLHRASNILFAEREWVPNLEEQAESRLHRNGQKSAVTSYYLVAMGTYDDRLVEFINAKRALFASMMKVDEVQETVIAEVLRSLKEG